MAKLNGVKTIDMINGEITKVSYEGAEYTKVDSGKKGDIGLVINAWGDQEVGEYFVVKRISQVNGKFFTHIDGNNYSASCYDYDMKYFRKVSEVAPTIDERVTTLESDVAALKSSDVRAENREFKVGDRVKIIGLSISDLDYIGSIGEVIEEIDYGGDVRVKVNGTRRYYKPENIKLIKTTENIYEPKKGDIVVVTANRFHSRNAVGDIGKIINLKSYVINVEVPSKPKSSLISGNGHGFEEVRPATPSEIEQYEKDLHKASFSVGDYVKIVKSERNNVGAIGKIIEIGEIVTEHKDGSTSIQPFLIEFLTGNRVGGLSAGTADYFVKATEEEVSEALKPKLKAGDFVKVNRKLPHYDNDKVYEIVKQYGQLGVIDEDGDFNEGAIGYGDYEIVDVETTKWAKIGRKVNEYRAGDIIEYGSDDDFTMPPRFYKVSEIIGNKVRFYCDEHGNETEYMFNDSKSIRLIAPVESLFTTQN